MDFRRRVCRSEPLRAAASCLAALLLLGMAAGCDTDEQRTRVAGEARKGDPQRTAASPEYRVATAVRRFLVAFTEGDGLAACRLLTPERQAELIERSERPSCERAIALQIAATPVRDLERLGRSRVSKVALARARGTAEVLTPAKQGRVPESHTVRVRRIDGRWRVASDFFAGGLRGGRVPKPPPPPPRDPAEEREVAAVFERFRRSLERGDGKAACDLRTPAARRAAVSQAIEAAGGRRQALSDYRELTCAAVSAGLRVPDERVGRITVSSAGARLTLRGGATYDLRKLGGVWRLDT